MQRTALCVVFTVCSSLRHFPAIASFSPAINSLVARGIPLRDMMVPYDYLWIAIARYLLLSGNGMLTDSDERV